ncbi:uncharacterized protein LOC135927868 [Gordionus sp. m RMFG-2023]|uniref:uncharacterized protein LOC135927868 n=1 Tax=Gordionus sp. m RMFG-2023 TaxID=3053472 RepID=UPI0031FCCA5A
MEMEMSLIKDCLFKENRIIKELHKGHLGAGKTKLLARDYLWWPTLNAEIDQEVRNCDTSVKVFERVHIDFAQFEGSNFLVCVDTLSKFPIIRRMRDITTMSTIKKILKIISMFGIPNMIISDNATSPLQTTSNTTSEISETDSSQNMNEANLENQEEEDGVGDYGVSLLHFDFKTNKDEEETQSSSSSCSVSHCQEATMSKKSSNGSIQIPGDLGQNKPNQIKLNNYAKKDIHGRQRSFQKSWYRGRDWLEYSVEADAAFCFPCRKYLCNLSDEFGQTGFRNWKNALAAKKGLLKHESSKAHLNSITIWHDKNQNINNGTEITKMLGGDQINRNQYYIKSIFDLMLFLSIQELPFRGTGSTNITDAAKDENIIYSSGLFIAMFSYTIQKDPELNKIMKFIPQNAQYTSPQIQNEVISIMADMVLEHISDKYNKSEMPFFCLKADETKDALGCENLSIIIRYIFSGEIQENLIGIINLECLSAESITDCILKQLNDLNINSANIISQSYDGANVMSGRNGGVQTLLQKKLIKLFLLYIATTTSCIL